MGIMHVHNKVFRFPNSRSLEYLVCACKVFRCSKPPEIKWKIFSIANCTGQGAGRHGQLRTHITIEEFSYQGKQASEYFVKVDAACSQRKN